MNQEIRLDTIVSFGRYKGQPMANMLADRDYIHWLSSQSWLAEKFPALLNAIKEGVSAANEESCTPEHNEMQIRFLDENLCLQTVIAYGALEENPYKKEFWSIDQCRRVDTLKTKQELTKAVAFIEKKSRFGSFIDVTIDYTIETECESLTGIIELKKDYKRVFLELKPVISEDYPAILRKAQRDCIDMVICDRFESTVASFNQVADLYKRSGILLFKFNHLTGHKNEVTEIAPNTFWVQ